MAKKLSFLLLIIVMTVAGTVVSMATGDSTNVTNDYSEDMELPEDAVINKGEPNKEEYAHEAVLDEYGTLFCNKESGSKVTILDEIKINRDTKNENIQDYIITGMITEGFELEDNDVVVLMVFVEKENGYVILGKPVEGSMLLFSRVVMPFTGENNPNNIRLVVFPKNSYKVLKPDENLQITDIEVIVKKQKANVLEKIKDSLINTVDSLKQLVNVQ